mmetsp:Transcript_93879/g.137097  ORF Transcript_93879/g.137097 Transcript_93879/m.137097 type:complete len:372 (+) Transcript_93879:25-1140(+)
MARHQQLVPVVGIIAAGVVVLLCVVQVYQSRNGEIVALSAPQALVDLQPLPAEESLKPIDFHKNKRAIVHSSTRFSACVDSAATVDEGVWCMGQLLTMLPRPLEKRALEVAKEVHPSKTVQGDPKILALKLETCLTHASERDGAVFCVADLLSHVPPAVLNKAVELGEEHPAFDWEDGHAAAVHDAAVFNTCVDTAGNVGEGVSCLGSLLTELPEALVERSVRITSELPPPHQPAEEPQMLSKDFVYCLQIAEKRDAAQYCLAHFLGRLPDEQVHEAYEYAKTHRGKGRPFLTAFEEENEELISKYEGPSGVEALPGLGFGVGSHNKLSSILEGKGGEGLSSWKKMSEVKSAVRKTTARIAAKRLALKKFH